MPARPVLARALGVCTGVTMPDASLGSSRNCRTDSLASQRCPQGLEMRSRLCPCQQLDLCNAAHLRKGFWVKGRSRGGCERVQEGVLGAGIGRKRALWPGS